MQAISALRKKVNPEADARAAVKKAKEQLDKQREAKSRIEATVRNDGLRKLQHDLRAAKQRYTDELTAATIENREVNPTFEEAVASLERRIREFESIRDSDAMRDAIQRQAEECQQAEDALKLAQHELFRATATPTCEQIISAIEHLGELADELYKQAAECGGSQRLGQIPQQLLRRENDWQTDVALRFRVIDAALEAFRHSRSHRGGNA